MYRHAITIHDFLNGSEQELNEPMFEVKGNVYKEHKFSELSLWRVRTNNISQTKVLKFLAKGQCTILYELHVLFIKWFELVGEIEAFPHSLSYRSFTPGKLSFLLWEISLVSKVGSLSNAWGSGLMYQRDGQLSAHRI